MSEKAVKAVNALGVFLVVYAPVSLVWLVWWWASNGVSKNVGIATGWTAAIALVGGVVLMATAGSAQYERERRNRPTR